VTALARGAGRVSPSERIGRRDDRVGQPPSRPRRRRR
jgi:hypothetical protein